MLPLARLLREHIFSRCALFALAIVCPAEAATPYSNGVFPKQTPGSASGWTTENAFPALTFIDPLWITQVPGSNEMVVLTKVGQIWRFPNDPAVQANQKVLVVDLSSKLQINSEIGLQRMVFHPEFAAAGSEHADEVFVCYSHRPEGTAAMTDSNMWRISRFRWDFPSGTINPASEEVLMQQYDPGGWHNGGAMAFDKDGFLLITCGDGGSANDFYRLSQKLDFGFFGGVLRIDVDNDPSRSHPIRRQPQDPANKPAGFPASFSQGYGIPNDNPWQDAAGGVLEEFFCIGLRSPHSAHYDPVEGELWVGDVGQSAEEELDCIQKGGNYGWSYREGTRSGPVSLPAGAMRGFEVPPVYAYGRTVGGCILGAVRYRGAKWANELGGQVIIGDNVKGNVSAVTLNAPATPLVRELVSNLGPGIYSGLAGITTDSAGEVYILKLNGSGQDGGKILKLARSGVLPEPPALLSQTGLFTDTASLTPRSDLVPYQVANPLWSDGAEKKRWIVRGNTAAQKVTYREEGNWGFPAGTVFVKHFEMPLDARNPALVKRLETRVMVAMEGGGKYGVTYRWNAAGTDAELLSSGAEESFPVIDADGHSEVRKWSYPSRADCMTCHTPETGAALGLRTHQLNLPIKHPTTGYQVNQIQYLNSPGSIFASGVASSAYSNALSSAGLDDDAASLEHRVRSYLDSNCAHCHRPDGSAAFFDARLETPLRGQNLINGLISGHFDPGAEGRYLKPGNPALSAVHARMASDVPGIAMPPLGRHVVDEKASDLLREYIESLTEEEFEGLPDTQARYIRVTSTSGTHASMAEFTILDGKGFPIPSDKVSVSAASAGLVGALAATDGNPATAWSTGTATAPHFITFDLGSVREIGGYIYLPRQDSSSGRISGFEIHLGTDGSEWALAEAGTWPTTSANPIRSDVTHKPRPVRSKISGPSQPVKGGFEVTISFDSNVHDFQQQDLVVGNGTITGFRGKGYYYRATIEPLEDDVTSTIQVDLAENAVNGTSTGSRAAHFSAISLDAVPPVISMEPFDNLGEGRYRVKLTADEPLVGLDSTDFEISNGRIAALEGSGNTYFLTLEAYRMGDVFVRLLASSVSDATGNLVTDYVATGVNAGAWHSFSSGVDESSVPVEGFRRSYDYINSPDMGWRIFTYEGQRAGNTTLDPAIKAVFSFVVPRAGQYTIRGLTLADNAASDSFYVGVDGQANPKVWHTNAGPGEIGDGRFYWSSPRASGADVRWDLTAGAHTVEIYGRDDGAALAKLELVPVRPFPTWGDIPVETTVSPFTVPLGFSRDVSGLTAGDFEVAGGSVVAVQGSGREYQITILPSASEVEIVLPENKVDSSHGTNTASYPWRFVYLNAYRQWAAAAELDGSPESYLADPDGDGVGQLVEFAFGLDPERGHLGGSGGLGLPSLTTVQVGEETRLVLHYVRRRGAPGLSYVPQFAGQLGAWEDSTAIPVVENLDETWEQVTVTDIIGGNPRFGRVKVELSD